MNALSKSTFSELIDAALMVDSDPEVRAVIFTGTGGRAFSAGVDLKELHENGKMDHPMGGLSRNLNEVVLEMTKPTIASINGVAAGGGCELALACDIRIASSNSKIGLPESKVGMGANFGSVMLPRLIPRGAALEALFTGDLLDAQEAYRLGLINYIIEPNELLEHSYNLAKKIAKNAPLSIQRMKTLASKSVDLPVSVALRLPAGQDLYNSEDRIEGTRAFLEKRKPNFKGK